MFEALYSLDTQEKQTLLTSLRYIRNTSSVQCFRELFCLKTLKLWFYIFSSLSHTDVSGVAKILFCVVFPLGCQNTDKTVTIFSSIENKKKLNGSSVNLAVLSYCLAFTYFQSTDSEAVRDTGTLVSLVSCRSVFVVGLPPSVDLVPLCS